MKKYYLLFLLLVGSTSFSQDNNCNPFEQKIQFEGKAPAPWGIDGSVLDWQTLLGTYTGDVQSPYNPEGVGNNWSLDVYKLNYSDDLDTPAIRNDVVFMAHTSDAYNVYLYARRQDNAPGEHTLFYFIDINVDGYMNTGEPVLRVQFNHKRITQLSLEQYVVNEAADYIPSHGNYMTAPEGPYLGQADGYTITGSTTNLFAATKIPAKEKLSAGEVFAAAVTEDGYGLEIAIPWRYLRNWSYTTEALQAEDLFTYHAAIQNGGGSYLPQRVDDNIAGCCGGLGVSGNAEVLVSDLHSTTLREGAAYRFQFMFTNNTNVEEMVGMRKVILDNIIPASGAEPDLTGLRMTAYRDDNCDGEAEIAVKQAGFEFYNEPEPGVIIYSSMISIAKSLKPGESVCFIVELEMQPDQFESFSIYFNPDLSIAIPPTGCFFQSIIDGGKPINPAAFFISTGFVTSRAPGTGEELTRAEQSGIRVFPNPAKGTINLWLPEGSPRTINLLDNTGRLVQQWRGALPGMLPIRNLARGVYFLRVGEDDGKKVVTKKFLIE